MIRRCVVFLALAAATACSGDDPGATPAPTVPTTTAPTTTAAAPEVTGEETPDTPPDTSTTTTGPPPVPPAGDLDEVSVTVEQIATLDEPVSLTTVPGRADVWIASRGGVIVSLDPDAGEVADAPVLDLTELTRGSREQGLLGIVADETHLYVDYTDREGHTHVDAFALDDDGVDPASRTELLFQEQPFRNHNGGGLAFDPDGYLVVGFGDGGSAGDPLNAGQDPGTWLGSLVRIEPTPDGPDPYTVPPDNPFVDGGGRPEVFVYGVRNPWRFSFDRLTGDLWIGDVGQDAYEEITVLLAANGGGGGANLGWNLREGLHEYSGPEPEGHVDPVYEYSHAEGVSVTGGYVYRGSEIPDLFGHYVFGDYSTARVWAIGIDTGEVEFRDLGVAVPGGSLASFGEGPDGELYLLSLEGPVSRLVRS